MEPMLKASEIKRLKLADDKLLSSFASNFNLRRYTGGFQIFVKTLTGMTYTFEVDTDCTVDEIKVGRCRLPVSDPW